MITIEEAKPGTEVVVNDSVTTVLTGHYEEPNIGWMIKTAKYPGGFPAKEHFLLISDRTDVQEEEPQGITFEIAIIEKEEPVKLTAELIRQKLKPLYDLTIENYLDDKGYEEVKKGKNKAVKARTAIEKKEKEVLTAIKARHATEIKQVTDYTCELYKACLEAQNDLQAKLDKADKEKQAEADRLSEERKKKTEAREAKLFELGLTWNGVSFVGYGKPWMSKESLYSMPENTYLCVVEELEGLQMEAGVTGKQVEQVVMVEPHMGSSDGTLKQLTSIGAKVESPVKLFDNQIYTRTVGEYTFVLTKGQVTTIEGHIIANDRVAESGVYAQIILKRL